MFQLLPSFVCLNAVNFLGLTNLRMEHPAAHKCIVLGLAFLAMAWATFVLVHSGT